MRGHPLNPKARDQNLELAKRLLAGMGSDEAPQLIAELFADDADVEVPGDNGVLPWIGHRKGREAAAGFIAETRELLEPLSFQVDDILANDERSVIVGALASRIRATGKVVETDFVLVLTTAGGRIQRFQMLEDSFAVSRAACGS